MLYNWISSLMVTRWHCVAVPHLHKNRTKGVLIRDGASAQSHLSRCSLCESGLESCSAHANNVVTECDMEGPERASNIAHLLELGQLPRKEPMKVWGGRGEGAPCACCGRRICASQVQYDLEYPELPILRMHFRCYMDWHAIAFG